MDAELEAEKSNFISFMSRHLVALTCSYELLKPSASVPRRGTLVFTGFVLELLGDWYWVTAGHCLKESLDKQIESGLIRIVNGGFIDYFDRNAKHVYEIPYTYEPDNGLYVDEADMGLDFGLIRLDLLKRAALEKNGIIALSRANWETQRSLEFEYYQMLGIPEHHICRDVNENDPFSIGMRPQMLAVGRLGADEVTNASSSDWFMGRLIQDAADVDDISGMSGGPIFGFRQQADGRWTYHIVAVQSRWLKTSKIIFGCSLPFFAEAVHKMLTKFAMHQASRKKTKLAKPQSRPKK